jgi:hypothetical protein
MSDVISAIAEFGHRILENAERRLNGKDARSAASPA